jgi:hypothetical protein
VSLKSHGGMILAGKNLRTLRKTCPSALFTTNPTWSDPGANPAFYGEKPATNHLSHSTDPTQSYEYLQPVYDKIPVQVSVRSTA